MKLLASDYDGTIRLGKHISYRNLKAIRRWRKKGNRFCIVTGRSMESIWQEMRLFGMEVDYLIGNNGAVVLDENAQILRRVSMDYDKAMAMVKEVSKQEIQACVLSNGFHRAKVVSRSTYNEKKFGSRPTTFDIADIEKEKIITQIVVSVNHFEEDNRKEAIVLNEKYGDFITAMTNRSCIDIVAKGMSKADGIAFLMECLHMNKDDVYVIGDSFNDASMLQAYASATLPHASKEIKAMADEVVWDVAAYIEKLEK